MSLVEVAAWCMSATPSLQPHSFIIPLTLIIYQAAAAAAFKDRHSGSSSCSFTKGQINQSRCSGSTLVFFHFKKHAALAAGLIRAPWKVCGEWEGGKKPSRRDHGGTSRTGQPARLLVVRSLQRRPGLFHQVSGLRPTYLCLIRV